MVTSPYGMLQMMGNSSFAKEAASPSVAELSWLIVGLAYTESDSAPAEDELGTYRLQYKDRPAGPLYCK